jgi:hypothetical protein
VEIADRDDAAGGASYTSDTVLGESGGVINGYFESTWLATS